MRKLPIFYNALLLTGVNLLLRFVGTGFQVYLSSRIGAEGIGLLQLVMSVGSMALVAGIAGIRTSTMYLTAEELGKNRPKRIGNMLSGCIRYSLAASLLAAFVLYRLSPVLAQHWIGHPETVGALRLLALLLPLNCLCAVMVGYFTGAGKILTLAAVEIAEQLCTMVVTLLLLGLHVGDSAPRACEAVILGSAAGTCLTFVSLVVLRLREAGTRGERGAFGKRILSSALPLALADDLRTGITTLENGMVPKRLALYPGSISPLAAFGMICGMVFPILMFPASLLFGLTELLIPELARCNAAGHQGRIHYLVRKSLRIALLYGTTCAGILYLLSGELCQALYHSAEAGKYLGWFAPLAVMLYADTVTDAMIKGLGQQRASVRYNILTSSMDVALLFVLLPKMGVKGYFISFLVTHALNFALSLGRLLKITQEEISVFSGLLCLGSGVVAVAFCRLVPAPVPRILCFFAILCSLLYLAGILRKEDLLWIQGLLGIKKPSRQKREGKKSVFHEVP